MRIAETSGALLCYRTEPALKLMRREAVISGIGNARLSSFEPMLCRTALGKLPLVLTLLANRALDENLEARAKVMLTSPRKLSPTPYVSSPGPAVIRRKVSTFDSCLPIPSLHKSIVFTPASGCRSSREQRRLNDQPLRKAVRIRDGRRR